MTHIDPGLTGAKRASWRDINPRALLAKIIADNPHLDEQQWRELLWDQVKDDTTLLYAIVEYWLDNNVRSITDERTAKKKARVNQTTVKQTLVGKLRDEALKLLDLVMPNGKTLRQCTGQDCRRFGGWATRIAKHVPAKKMVGDVLSEAQVSKLWQTRS